LTDIRVLEALLPDACLGCSSCVAACPVSASDGGFAGPKVLGPALNRRLERGWPGQKGLTAHDIRSLGAELCVQCHQCDLACPVGIKVSALTRRAKTLARSAASGGGGLSAGERLLLDQDRLGRLAALTRLPRRAARVVSPGLAVGAERLGMRALGLSPSRSLPEPAGQEFTRWFRATRRPEVETGRPPVILYAGCHTRFYDPRAGQAAVTVLRAAGCRVVLPIQLCCGSPALSVGEEGLAARAASANLRLLGHASDRLGGDVPIVSPCPSCTLALRDTLPELAPGAAADRLAARVWDLGEFLAGPARRGLDRAMDGAMDGARTMRPWAYHTPCHLRALGTGRVFPGLLGDFGLGAALDPGPAADGCCGMGGFAGLTRSGYGRSLATGARVLETYGELAAGAVTGARSEPEGGSGGGDGRPLLLSDCPTCRWQIADVTGLETAHPVELLASSVAVSPDGASDP